MKPNNLIALLVAILIAIPALAEVPEGTDDPAFRAALETWLADNDAGSLPELAELAGSGNTAAQILLARIAQHEVFSSLWIDGLSRTERRALFRAPGGAFGQSWLAVAASSSELARKLETAGDANDAEAVIAGLFELGEFHAMFPAVSRLVNHGNWESLVRLGHQGALPPEWRYAAWYAALFVSSREAQGLTMEASTSMRTNFVQGTMYFSLARPQISATSMKDFEVYRQLALFLAKGMRAERGSDVPLTLYFENGKPKPEWAETALKVAQFLMEADETQQLAYACRRACPDDTSLCAATSWMMLRGYSTYLELGSPVETLISRDRYSASPRAQGELFRRLAQFPYPSGLRAKDVQTRYRELPACVAQGIRAALSR